VDPWQGLYLTFAGSLELSNSCMSSLPMFVMSMYMLFDTIHAIFDKVRSRFFWEGVGQKRKYHMIDWVTVVNLRSWEAWHPQYSHYEHFLNA
jgi:hypothetical protein